MGHVYAVVDESTGARLALKRLGGANRRGTTRQKARPAADRDSALHFRLEYTMLARLRHPSIIDVYEYGVDAFGAYYTMELLDGRDLREAAPMPYREACQTLRDVASSLALLHAHRLVHRDVSPRNIRATRCGRSKLFDFGTLTPFGIPRDVAGTPAYVAPEALDGGPLDHRADLYSLGAVLYWLLTGRDAFAARQLEELPRLLGELPARPSALSTEVPHELDALVLSMLSRDPVARPSSAAEVIERLDAIGRLPPEGRREVAESYFLSAKTVGRARELARVSLAVEGAVGGHGGGLLVEGAPGCGKTRLARDVVREAEVRGATVLLVDGSLHESPSEALAALGRRLVAAAPDDAFRTALRHTEHVGRLLPELLERFPSVGLAAPVDAPGEQRARLFVAVQSWLLDFSDERPLVVVVDDLDRAGDGTLAFFGALAHAAAGRRLLVVATASARAAVTTAGFGEVVVLRPLDARAVLELVQSLFGDAPRTERVASWLHAVSGGNPLHVMQLVQHLATTRAVRYADGAWTLPDERRLDALPKTVGEATEARLGRLRPAARSLAEALSVAKTPLPLALCIVLADADDGSSASDAMALVDELVSEGVLVGSAGRYRFSEESLRERLFLGLAEERRRRLHREVGEALAVTRGDRVSDAIAAGWHLLQGGEEDRGAALLADTGRRLVTETDEFHAAVPALEAAFSVFRSRGRPAHELVSLVGPLVASSFFVDRRFAMEYGALALELFREATGIAQGEELRSMFGPRFALGVAVAGAVVERRLGASGATHLSTRELFELFYRSAMTVGGVASVCLDHDGVKRAKEAVEPLASLGDGHAGTWVYRYLSSLELLCAGRFGAARRTLSAVLAELEARTQRRAFPENVRRLFLGGALYALGAIETLSDGEAALRYADRLEAFDLRLYDMIANQLRMLHHAHRGESELVTRYRERVETYAAARGSAWQVEVWEAPVMLLVHEHEGNVVGLKRTAERLARLSREVPSLERYATMARGAYFRLRGEYAAALAVLEAAHRESTPFPGKGQLVGLLGAAYNDAGQHAKAELVTGEFLAGIGAEERPFLRMHLLARTQHALALSGMGHVEEAETELERALEEHGSCRGPVTLGLLHCARARVALRAGDPASFEIHRAKMEEWLRPTGNPSLVSACERLRLEARRADPSARILRLGGAEEVSTSRRSVGG
jgi:tetratricopeptide (TPR) repeat protein